MTCPECGSALNVPQDVMEHEIISCEACGVELEVLSTAPLQVGLAPEEEEDWGE